MVFYLSFIQWTKMINGFKLHYWTCGCITDLWPLELTVVLWCLLYILSSVNTSSWINHLLTRMWTISQLSGSFKHLLNVLSFLSRVKKLFMTPRRSEVCVCVYLYTAVVPHRHQTAKPGGDTLGTHPGAPRGGAGQRRAERPAMGRSLGWTTAGQNGHQ